VTSGGNFNHFPDNQVTKFRVFIARLIPDFYSNARNIQGGPQKSKPLPNYEKILSNRIKVCQRDKISPSN